jgi:hypothetical protein
VESENRTVIIISNMVGRNGNLARSARGLDVIIVNPGIIMVPFQEQGSLEVANGLRYYPGKEHSSRL